MMQHVITEVPFYRDRTLVPGYDVGGKTGTAQIWDPKANRGRGAWKHNLFNYSFVGYIGRADGSSRTSSSRIRIEEGTPTVAKVGHLEMPVMSFELFRRIATDAITTPDLLPAADPTTPPRPRTGDGGLCDTGAVTDVDPSTPAPERSRRRPSTADDLVRLTGGRLLARSDRPIRGAAVDSRLVEPGQLFVALPGERTDGHALSWPTRSPAARPPSSSPGPLADPSDARRRDGHPGRRPARGARRDRRRLAAPVRAARRRASPGASPRPRPRRPSRPSSRSGSGRCATRATRTTRSACR